MGRDRPSDTEDTATSELKGFDDFTVRLGDMMRGERATLGKSLLDVQRDLKIKAAYIAAIENSDPSAFETQGFVAGYVRSYARYLGMDPEWTFETFCKESGFSTAHGMSKEASDKPSQPAQKQQRAKRAPVDPLGGSKAPFTAKPKSVWSEIDIRAIASVAVLGVLVAGLGYGGWTVLQEVQKVRLTPVAQAPETTFVVDPLADVASVAEQEVDVDVSGPTASALDRLYRPEPLDVPVLVARDGPISAVDPDAVGAWAGFSMAMPEVDSEPASPIPPEQMAVRATPAPDPNAPGEPGAVQVLADGPPDVVLFAVRPAWVRVQAGDGTVLFEKILDAGERYTVPQNEVPPVLRAGNSGSVYMEVAGQTYGPVGDSASVAKDVALSVEAVREVYQIADMSADPALEQVVAEAAAAAAAEAEAPAE
ncbi:MAG: RodZ domain-containing protein [Pseudomonadota bacterium]